MLGKFFSAISKTKAWAWFARSILGHLTFRFWGYPQSALFCLQEIENIIRTHTDDNTVTVFTCCDRATLVAKAIKWITRGRFTHAGYVWSPYSTSHINGSGMQYQTLAEVIGICDDFALVTFTLKAGKEEVLRQRIEAAINAEYDFTQTIGGKNLYCSEYVYYLLNGIVEENLSLRLYKGQIGFSPDDVYNSGKVIFDHNPS